MYMWCLINDEREIDQVHVTGKWFRADIFVLEHFGRVIRHLDKNKRKISALND